MAAEWYLGLDGGGTGCRAVLADASGRVAGRGASGPANIMSDREGALAAIMAAAGQAMGAVPPAQVTACLGLAGANISGARDWLGPMLPFARVRVVHDAVTAVAGALGPRDGIVAAMGTGSVFSRRLGDAVESIGGWGPVLGDEGGGAWLARRFLARCLQAGDGLAEATPLMAATLAKLGGADGAVAFARTASAADFAALVPGLLAVPDAGFAAVLAEGADYVARAIDRLQEGRALPVVFTGGLGPLYADRLAGRWPILAAQGNGLDGALRLALAMG